MNRTITSGLEALQGMKRGIDKLADTVKSTLGPKGNTVIIEGAYYNGLATKDGVTVANNITLEDKLENQGATLVKSVASRANDVAGDGTTTSSVLAQAIATEGLKMLSTGHDGQTLKSGMEKAAKAISEQIRAMSVPVEGDMLKKVASISANDEEIGSIVADIVGKLGKDAIINVDVTHAEGIKTEIIDGLQFDRGYVHPFFAMNVEGGVVSLENPLILVTESRLLSEDDARKVATVAAEKGKKEFVIIAEDIEGEALGFLVKNQFAGHIRCAAIKAPGFANHKKELLTDIATYVGATMISESLGSSIESMTAEDLGSASKVTIGRDATTIFSGNGDKEQISARVSSLKELSETTESDFERERYKERIAKLTDGIGVIKVGAAVELEAKEKKHRIEDAIRATQAALAEGIVPGGGVALIRAAKNAKYVGLQGDEVHGANILIKATGYPLRCIAENAGQDGGYILGKVGEFNENQGYNAKLNRWEEDMVAAGIIDPAKVTRTALEMAVSAMSQFLTTKAVINNAETKKEA